MKRRRGVGFLSAGATVGVLLLLPLASSGAADAATWSGSWDTHFSTGVTKMVLKQSGSAVTGTYAWCNGTLQGTVSGSTLRGTWSQTPNCGSSRVPNGPFEFTISADGRSFDGDWRYADDTDWRASWDGTCVAGPCLENGEKPGTATFLFSARQLFTDGGRVTVAASAKFTTRARCKEIACVRRDLKPVGVYYGLWTQEDGNVRIRFRITSASLLRTRSAALHIDWGATVTHIEADRPQDAQGCAVGTSMVGHARNHPNRKPDRAGIRCGKLRQVFRTFNFRLVGTALTS